MERKPSKRDIEWSRANLLRDTERHKLNSDPDEVWFKNHIKIDNTNLEPDEVASIIINTFQLTANEKEELADVAIYLLSLSEILGIDLEQEILRKIEKNSKRIYKHVDGVSIKIEG